MVPSILRSFRNPAIKSLILAWFMDGLQAGILITLLPFYLRYYIQPDGPAAVAAGQVIAPTSFIGNLSASIALPFGSTIFLELTDIARLQDYLSWLL